MTKSAEEILKPYEGKVADLAHSLREFVMQNLPGIIEMPDAPARMIAYGYGPGYKDMICTIIPSKKGLKLGFYKGSELPDPRKLLGGSGKVHRYVEIFSEKDFKNAGVKQLIKEAIKAYKKRRVEK